MSILRNISSHEFENFFPETSLRTFEDMSTTVFIHSIKDSKNLFSSLYKYFSNHLNNVLNFLKNIKENINNTINNFFRNNVEDIKIELFNIASKLNEFEYFKNEFLAFLSIKEMITYILEKDILNNMENLVFSESLLVQFLKLLDSKSQISNSSNTYEIDFDNFNSFLNSKQEEFYTKIYVPSHKYDDLIDDVTNILG